MRYRDMQERLLVNSMAVWCGHVDDEGQASDCWLWVGNVDDDGYGRLTKRVDGKHKKVRAHRESFEVFTGRLLTPEETLDHKCRQVNCIAPLHLEVLSNEENASRMQQFWKNYREAPQMRLAA